MYKDYSFISELINNLLSRCSHDAMFIDALIEKNVGAYKISGTMDSIVLSNCISINNDVTICLDGAKYLMTLPDNASSVSDAAASILIQLCGSLPGTHIIIKPEPSPEPTELISNLLDIPPQGNEYKYVFIERMFDGYKLSGKLASSGQSSCKSIESEVTVCVDGDDYMLSLPNNTVNISNPSASRLIQYCNSLPGNRMLVIP